jgi:hypothetical protein
MVQCSKKTTKLGYARPSIAKNAYLTMNYRNFAAALIAAISADIAAAFPAISVAGLRQALSNSRFTGQADQPNSDISPRRARDSFHVRNFQHALRGAHRRWKN